MMAPLIELGGRLRETGQEEMGPARAVTRVGAGERTGDHQSGSRRAHGRSPEWEPASARAITRVGAGEHY